MGSRDTGRVVIRVIVSVLIVLLSLIEIATNGNIWVVLIDLGIIVAAVGFALGKQRAGDITIVLVALIAALMAYQWLAAGDGTRSFITVVWVLLFVGVWYAKPTTVTMPSDTPPDPQPDATNSL